MIFLLPGMGNGTKTELCAREIPISLELSDVLLCS